MENIIQEGVIAIVDAEMMFTVVTLNGRGFMFDADEVVELGGEYVFSLEGETVGQFKKDSIAGYFITRYEDEDSQDYD